MKLAGNSAIVCGGSGAIGAAVAARLAAGGCDVAVIDKNPSRDVSAAIQAAGRRAFAFAADLSDVDEARRAIAQAVAALDGLAIFVNTAGITSFGPAAALGEAEWDRVMSINLKSVFFCCQAALEPLKSKGGRIINIGSVLGKNGGNARPWIDPSEQQRSGNVAYGVSKAGVHMLTAYLAREVANFGITVNAVAPGPIVSAMTQTLPDTLRALIPVGRLGTPQDVANAVAFLAAEASAYITGEILDVNGGMWSD